MHMYTLQGEFFAQRSHIFMYKIFSPKTLPSQHRVHLHACMHADAI